MAEAREPLHEVRSQIRISPQLRDVVFVAAAIQSANKIVVIL
jgi:hypothetical protein